MCRERQAGVVSRREATSASSTLDFGVATLTRAWGKSAGFPTFWRTWLRRQPRFLTWTMHSERECHVPPPHVGRTGGGHARQSASSLKSNGSPPFVLKTEDETFGQPFRRGQETRAEQTVNRFGGEPIERDDGWFQPSFLAGMERATDKWWGISDECA